MKTRLISLCIAVTLSVSCCLSKTQGKNLPPIVYAARTAVATLAEIDRGAIPGFGPLYRTLAVGGTLEILNPDGSTRTLVGPDQLYDVSDPCVSWDAKGIVFAGTVHRDSSWRLYFIKRDGSGFRQITFTDRKVSLAQFGAAAKLFGKYDDIDPCFLPDGRIVFSSTRYPTLASVGGVLATNLFILNPDSGTIHRITSERNGADEPTIDPITGRIVYARWWVNVDLPSNVTKTGLTREESQALTNDIGNVWHAMSIDPDGDELKLYAGFPRTRFGSQTYKPYIMNDGRLLSVFSPVTALTPTIGGTGIRWFKQGADFEHHIIGVRSDESLRGQARVDGPYATDPVELEGNEILFSYSRNGENYALYRCSLDGSGLRKVHELPGYHLLDSQILAVRTVPPILHDKFLPPVNDLPPTEDPLTYFKYDTFRFDCMNIYTNGAVDEQMPDAPNIAKDASILFFMNVQRQSPGYPDPSIYLKDAPVFNNGGVHEHDLPAEVSMFEQIVDDQKRVLEAPRGKFAHVPGMNFERQGAGTKCVGCHAGHTLLEVPINGTMAEWFNVSTSARVTASSSQDTVEWASYSPRRVVDRQARTGGDSVFWASKEGEGASIMLNWDIPVQVREFILYNITPNEPQGTNIVVQNSEILLYYQGSLVGQIPSTGGLSPEGTRVDVTPTVIDRARITITNFTGTIVHKGVAGLAEIETIARIASSGER